MRKNVLLALAGLLLGVAAPMPAQHAVTTVAGGGETNVAAKAASIGQPAGMAIDKAGDVFIADSILNRVYRVSAAGTLTVVAGNGGINYSGVSGPAVSTQIGAPQDVAVDSTGNIYIVVPPGVGALLKVDAKTGLLSQVYPYYGSDTSINRVFIDGSGHIFIVQTQYCMVTELNIAAQTQTTVAGTLQSCGYKGDNAAATSAMLNAPGGAFVDASGNIFIADTGNNVIREVIAKTGIIKTVAGNGAAGYSGDGLAATSAELSGPNNVWVDGSGNILISDNGNNVLRKVTGGKIYTVAGNGKAGYLGDGGLATAAELNGPTAVVMDASQNILIADQSNSVIRRIVAATKDIQTYAGNGQLSHGGDGGAATNAQLFYPSGVAVDSFGNIYIADQFNNAVREVVAATGKIQNAAGTGKAGYSGDGGPATKALLDKPYGVFVDAADNLYIADTSNHAIRKVQAATGTISTVTGNGSPGYSGDGGSATGAQLNGPSAVYVDRTGNIIIADSWNNAIREVTASNGKIKTIAGNGSWGYSGDNGLATSAQLKDPSAVYVDGSGNVLIADTGNNVIREVAASSGKITTIAGTGKVGYSGDGGLATSAQLFIPRGIYVDGGGNIFLTQGLNYETNYQGDVVREINAKTHMISTIAGDQAEGFLDSATATSAEFDTPLGLAGDRSGNLYVADSQNLRIRKIAGIQGTDISPLAPPPTFSPAAGVYPAAQTVTLKDAASGASIYFTTNGTTPTTGSTKYTTAIAVAGNLTINAVAVASGESVSPVAQASYTISSQAPAPTFSPLPGNFVGTQSVSLTTSIAGAVIHYTVNGSTPSATSAVYSAPIAVAKTTTIKAIAVAAGFKSNAVGSGAYVIQTQVAAPVFTPIPRGYWTAQSVTLNDSTTGAAIYYTLDGTTPTAKSAKYTGAAIPVSKTTTVKAIAIATGDLSSTVVTGLYTINNASLVEQRALAQQGFGLGLATLTFISQLSLSENVLLFGDDGVCGDASNTVLSLTQSGHLGGIVSWSPTSFNSPGYGTIYYDNNCTQPWARAELYDWTEDINVETYSLTGSTSETENFFGITGAPLGTMQLNESMQVTLKGNTLAKTDGMGVFTPKNGAPPAQLGLACSVSLVGFLEESEPSLCFGGIAQDFPNLDLSLGYLTPISFTPVITPGIAWTGSEFVAVSAAGAIFTSSNGATWKAQTSGSGNNLRSMASSGSELVVVGSGGTILTSKNGGSVWTAETSGTTANLAAVAWSGTQFVAVGVGVILTSPNGTTWTSRDSGTGLPYLTGVAWSGKEFVAVGGEMVLTSPDGITWTAINPVLNSGSILENVTWSGTQFVAVGTSGGGYGEPTIIYSTDGKTWKSPSAYIYVNTQNNLNGVVWSPQKKLFVAVGKAGTIVTSPDANTWTTRTSNTTYDLKAIVWSGMQFVAIGSANSVVTSPDGITWTAQNSAPGFGQMVRFSSTGSSVVTGPLGGLQMTAPTTQTLSITGGSPYGGATYTGYAGDLAVFIPTPTGWTATDAAHDQKLQITMSDDTKRMFTGSITQISTGKTLTTFSVDRSGTGTITYSDGSKAVVTNWLPAD